MVITAANASKVNGHDWISKIHRTPSEPHDAQSVNGTQGSRLTQASTNNCKGGGPGARNHGRPNARISERLSWQELGGDFLHFTLYKENRDTMESITYIARSLDVSPREFNFAGTKDRRGVTAQRVSVRRVRAGKFMPLLRSLRGSSVGNFKHERQGLRLGDLTGNEFLITLRDCQFDGLGQSSIQARLEYATSCTQRLINDLEHKGFINYFGLQRFGTFTSRTDTTGMKILQEDFKGAVDLILDFDQSLLHATEASSKDKVASDERARAVAIDLFRRTGRAHDAIRSIPRKFSAENALMRTLSISGKENNYLGALLSINRSLRLMYVHAYQSLIWNLAATYRWANYGNQVVEGDLVLVEEQAKESVQQEQVDADGEVVVHTTSAHGRDNTESPFQRARPLTKEEAESGKYTIFDVVLTMPGHDVLYPCYMTKFYEETMAKEEHGSFSPHQMKRTQKEFSLSGHYRELVSRPLQKMTFEIRAYSREDEQFVETDLDRMRKAAADRGPRRTPIRQETPEPRQEPVRSELVIGVPDKLANPYQPSDIRFDEWNAQHVLKSANKVPGSGQKPGSSSPRSVSTAGGSGKGSPRRGSPPLPDKLAVILKMQLGPGQYATMALRELMKSGGVQAYKPEYSKGT